MNEKLISNRREYIIDLFKHVLDIEITESNFKIYQGDEAVFFHLRGRSLYICFDEYKDQYLLYHLNEMQNSKRGTKYHLQRFEYNLGSIFAYLNTLHNPKDLNRKKSIEDLLFDKSNHVKGKPLD